MMLAASVVATGTNLPHIHEYIEIRSFRFIEHSMGA